jgi:TolA-binding protein
MSTPRLVQLTRRARLFPLLLLIACLAWACGTTAAVTVLTPDDLKLDAASRAMLPQDTTADLQYAFDQLALPTTTPKDKINLYAFISEVHLTLWNDKRNTIDALQPGQGDPKRILSDALPHFMKAQWAKALSRRELRVATDVYGQSAAFETRFADLWADYSNPQKTYDALKGLLDELLSSKDPVDPSFFSDVRYSLAIFYTLQNKAADSLAPFLALTRDDQTAALAFAQEVAFLQERLLAQPQLSAQLYAAIADATPTSRQGFEAQSLIIRALLKHRFFQILQAGSAAAFDASPAALPLFIQIKDAAAKLIPMSPTREQWPIAERQDVDKLDAATEESLRVFIRLLHDIAKTSKDPQLFAIAADTYTTYNKLFPYSGAAYELAYEHALALEAAGRPDDAYTHYQNAHKLNGNGQHKLDVVRGMMRTTFEKSKATPLPSEPSETRTSPPEAHARFIDASERFISTFEDDDKEAENIASLRYEIALRHYLYGAIPVAEPMLESYLIKFPDSPFAPQAAIVFLDLNARKNLRSRNKKDRAELDNAILRVQGIPAVRDTPTVQAKLADVMKSPPRVGKSIF